MALFLTACTAEETPPESGGTGQNAEDEPHFSTSWITREASVRTLARMLEEGEPEEVVSNIGDNREELLQTRILVQKNGEHRVELDKDAWDVPPGTTGELDTALYDAMDYNEVTWCGETMSGVEFTQIYVDNLDGTFDTAEDYYASIDDYVDCGTGEPR